MNLLEVNGLCKQYGAFALKEVSFCLAPGRIMGLIGKNGAGKSTTLKALVHMVQPDAGSIRMFGRDFFAEEAWCKQQIGAVLGSADFYGQKRLAEITDVTRRFYPQWDDAAYAQCLRLFELDDRKRMAQLSTGMQVKYRIALALSHHARLLLLDEPTSGLDPVSRDELLTLFRALVRDGRRAILFSTHITSDLDQCADDVTYLRAGALLCSAEKQAFCASFASLRRPGDPDPLPLAEIMVRCERREFNESFAV